MTSFKSILFLALAVAGVGRSANAAMCFKSTVDHTSVMGLKGTARLQFLVPAPGSEGFIKIVARGVDAETVVNFIRGGQPVRYVLEGDSGSFTQGSQDGVTTLNVTDGALAVRPDGEDSYSVYVQRSRRDLVIPSQTYRVELMTDVECRAAFPNQGR